MDSQGSLQNKYFRSDDDNGAYGSSGQQAEHSYVAGIYQTFEPLSQSIHSTNQPQLDRNTELEVSNITPFSPLGLINAIGRSPKDSREPVEH